MTMSTTRPPFALCSLVRERAVLAPLYAGTGPYGVAARRLAL